MRKSPLTLILVTATCAVTLVVAGCNTNSMLREKGYAAINAKDYDAARAYYQQAVNQNPTDYLSWYYLGVMDQRLNEPLKAQLAFEKALSLRANDPDLTPRILDRLATVMYTQEKYEQLETWLDEVTPYYGQTPDYLRQAKFLVLIGDVDSATTAYRKAAFFAPAGDATPYVAVADFYLELNDQPRAVQALKYAYYINPEDPNVTERFRQVGIVPGPTLGQQPPKPELFKEPSKPIVNQIIDHSF